MKLADQQTIIRQALADAGLPTCILTEIMGARDSCDDLVKDVGIQLYEAAINIKIAMLERAQEESENAENADALRDLIRDYASDFLDVRRGNTAE